MLTLLVSLSFAIAVSSVQLQQEENGTVTVQTEDGILRGKIATSIWNRTYHSFQNVPFAQPPVGDLRFKSPQPVKPWTGVRNALEQGTYCPQAVLNIITAKMSEDCLYLNVYVPKVPSSSLRSTNLSVLVFIYGGGYSSGTGVRDLYGPDNLMNLTAILVTFNYRLGAFGFLSMEHPEVTSNAGMKDQVAALRWVKRNIAQFGGNPDDVTVFGESAGGISVELLLLSNMSEGLFHRAISESGSAVLSDYNRSNADGTAYRLAEVLGHNATGADDLVKLLRNLTAEDLLKAQTLVTSRTEGTTSTVAFTPVIDAEVQEGSEIFLPDYPEKLIRAGRTKPIPFINGVNSEEMKFNEQDLTEAVLDNYNRNPEVLIPSFVNVEQGSTEALELGAKLKSFYFGNKSISYDTIPQLIDLITDTKIYAVHRSTMLRVNYGSSPVYLYLFTYDGSLHYQLGNYTIKGPAHGDELAYLFYLSYEAYNPNSDDMKVIHHFTNMWVDFAESGDPSLHESVKWTPITKTKYTYLQIDVELSLHEDLLKERMAFWDEVYNFYDK